MQGTSTLWKKLTRLVFSTIICNFKLFVELY
jgi:hypothetical protein